METISPEGFDFFTPQGYDKIYREGRKVLMNILDIEVPLIAAVNGPVRLHSEYVLLADIVLATPSTVFQDKPHFELGIVSGDGVHLLWQEAIGTIRGRYFILTRQELDAADGEGMGCGQRNCSGRQAASPCPRDRRRAREAPTAHHEVHAHRDDPEAAPYHRRGRHIRARIGGHQRCRCREGQMSETPKFDAVAANDKTPSGDTSSAKSRVELVTVNLDS